ncbi:hypothetical protein [Mucilaginibacter sp. dw_454]|uniref:hypothetical protein n=1 Tax=Mucilaginibacter sp. dw_454 TaxID=2720079 RepID=UPI001BD213E0|nr:hypothetical protein [Mucilaginibacter sp. dw_454]
MNIYYRIWASAIAEHREGKSPDGGWKLMPLVAMSVLMGINLLALFLLLHALNHSLLILFPVHIFDTTGYNTGIAVLITYFVPFVILNYLLIFYNNRYEEIVKRYDSKGSKLYRNYALISLGVIVIPLALKLIIFS